MLVVITRHLIYWVIPLLAVLAMELVYFSELDIRDWIAPYPQREFGILENLQNLLIIGIIAVAVAAIKHKELFAEKAAFAFITLFGVLVFLEEVDYGLHWYEWWKDIPPPEQVETRNLHNRGSLNRFIKLGVESLMVIWFAIMPLLSSRIKHPVIKYLLPSQLSVLTLLSAWAVTRLAFYLYDAGMPSNIALKGNYAEFTEVFTYYLFLVYLYEIVFRRKLNKSA